MTLLLVLIELIIIAERGRADYVALDKLVLSSLAHAVGNFEHVVHVYTNELSDSADFERNITCHYYSPAAAYDREGYCTRDFLGRAYCETRNPHSFFAINDTLCTMTDEAPCRAHYVVLHTTPGVCLSNGQWCASWRQRRKGLLNTCRKSRRSFNK